MTLYVTGSKKVRWCREREREREGKKERKRERERERERERDVGREGPLRHLKDDAKKQWEGNVIRVPSHIWLIRSIYSRIIRF